LGFAFEGLCFTQSFIPCDVWISGESHSNTVEVSHCDVYQEGKALTLLGGIQVARDFDLWKESENRVITELGI
jgi:hypothetical protein